MSEKKECATTNYSVIAELQNITLTALQEKEDYFLKNDLPVIIENIITTCKQAAAIGYFYIEYKYVADSKYRHHFVNELRNLGFKLNFLNHDENIMRLYWSL